MIKGKLLRYYFSIKWDRLYDDERHFIKFTIYSYWNLCDMSYVKKQIPS